MTLLIAVGRRVQALTMRRYAAAVPAHLFDRLGDLLTPALQREAVDDTLARAHPHVRIVHRGQRGLMRGVLIGVADIVAAVADDFGKRTLACDHRHTPREHRF